MGDNQNRARTLIDRIWGSDVLGALPIKWRGALRYLSFKTPGVSNDTLPDEPGVNGVITSQVVTDRTNEREKTTTKLDGSVLQHTYHEQQYDEQFDVVIPTDTFTTPEGQELGTPRTEIEGLIPGIDVVKRISPDTSVLDNYRLSFPSTTSVDAPDFLNSITLLLETTLSEGGAAETGQASWSGSHSLTVPVKATAQSSASLSGAIIPNMIPFYGTKRLTTTYMFFMPNPVTSDQITDRLAFLTGQSVVNWTNFQPRYITIVLVAKRESVRSEAGSTVHDSSSGDGNAQFYSINSGLSKESAVTVTTVRLPPTLHGNVSIQAENGFAMSLPILIEDSTTANSYAFTLGPFPFTQSVSAEAMVNCSLRVFASGLEATPGVTSFPSSGLLIVGVNARPYKYGYVQVQAEVLDASTL